MDIQNILSQMLDSVKLKLQQIAGDKLPQIIEAVTQYSQDANKRFSDMASWYAAGPEGGGVTKEFIQARLEEEKDVLKAILLSFEIMGEKIAEDVVNDAAAIIAQGIFAMQTGSN